MRVRSRKLRTLGCTAALAACGAAGVTGVAQVSAHKPHAHRIKVATRATRPARSKPVAIRDVTAARRVHYSRWEPRPHNRKENHRVPSKKAIRHFRRWSKLPHRYRKRVTGHFRGTTDEIIQWAAYKWGFHPNVLRAVATAESWWKMSEVGDHGHSFGIMQVKRGAHCCFPLTRRSTAFNVDYYAAWLRTVYDGRMRWLRHQPKGRPYRRGDLWGAVGAWYAGAWHKGDHYYVSRVKMLLRHRVWRRSGFWYGDH